MKTKIYLIILGMLILVVVGIFIKDKQISSTTDCSKPFGVIYLKEGEVVYDKDPQIVYVYPELNRVVGVTSLLKCENFNYADYIDAGDFE